MLIFLIKMALIVDMDVKAANSTNLAPSAQTPLALSKTNDSSCTAAVKHEFQEDKYELVERMDNSMLNMQADIKSEKCVNPNTNSEEMTKFNSSIDSDSNVAGLTDYVIESVHSGLSTVVKCDIVDSPIEKLKQTRLLSNNTKEMSVDNQISKIKKWNELWDMAIDIPAGLSKRQKKKYLRKVLWETKWKPLRRAKEKEKLKQKKLLALANNETLGPSRKMLKHSTMAASECKLRIALDFSFDDLMSEKDLSKCLKQLNHCYCLNRRAANPLQFYVTNFCGPARDQLGRGVAYKNWDVYFHNDKYLDLFKKEDLVYLTSDSDNTLVHLDHSKVYIIGALVDHNKYKGKTLEIAKNQEIDHAKLPISEFLQMNSRRVLTIDHVFEILVHASEGVSWKDSFLRVLPQRKGAMEKVTC